VLGVWAEQVQGEGIRNIYKVNPLINVKIPVGHTLNPHLVIYNPHDHVLEVKEIFTNEGFLHLTLPKGLSTAGKGGSLWEVAPMTSIKVMTLAFHATRPGRHTGFVHARTNVDTLIIPVELNVIKGGVHRWPDLLDFETVTSKHEKRELNITVLNSTPNPVSVTDVVLSSPDPLLQVVMKRGIVLQPNSESVVATVLYSGKTEGQFSGQLLVRTNDTGVGNKALALPYQAKVLHGKLAFSQTNTTFPIRTGATATASSTANMQSSADGSTATVVERWITLTNEFAVPVHLVTGILEDAGGWAFEVISFPADRTLQPRDKAPPIIVRLTADQPSMPASAWGNGSQHSTILAIHSNVSITRIALMVYDGALTMTALPLKLLSIDPQVHPVARQSDTTATSLMMDMGILGVRDERVYSLNISNPNPVAVDVWEFRGPSSKAKGISIKLLHILDSTGAHVVIDAKNKVSKLLQGTGKSKAKTHDGEARRASCEVPASIKPGHMLCLEVQIFSQKEEQVNELVKMRTSFQTIEMRLRYMSMMGSLAVEPALLELSPAFPGKVVSQPLFATSSFKHPLTITGMKSSEARMIAEMLGQAHNSTALTASSLILQPDVRTLIGYVRFDPSLGPPHENYMATSAYKSSEQHRDDEKDNGGVGALGIVRTADLRRMEKLSHIWASVSLKKQVNASISVECNMGKHATIQAVGTLERPEVLSAGAGGRLVNFPLTQLGQASEEHVSIENPSDLPMLAHLMLPPLKNKVRTGSPSLPCSSAQGCAANSHFLVSRAHMRGLVVPPRSWARLGPVFFVPRAEGVYVATAYVRTNLTYLYSVGLRGEGGSGKLELREDLVSAETCHVVRFDLSNYSSHNPLAQTQGIGAEGAIPSTPSHHDQQVEAQDQQVGAESSVTKTREQLSMTKVLALRNTGSLPIEIYSLGLNGHDCEWQGLRLHECCSRVHVASCTSNTTLYLAPSSKTSIRVSYRPDCTSSRTRVDLVAYTSVGTFKYKMLGSVGQPYLEACYRRSWHPGAGGVLQGPRHAWLCRAVLVLLVCGGLLIIYDAVAPQVLSRHVAGFRQSDTSVVVAGTSCKAHTKGTKGVQGNVMLQRNVTSDHYRSALAHIDRLRCKQVAHTECAAIDISAEHTGGKSNGPGSSKLIAVNYTRPAQCIAAWGRGVRAKEVEEQEPKEMGGAAKRDSMDQDSQDQAMAITGNSRRHDSSHSSSVSCLPSDSCIVSCLPSLPTVEGAATGSASPAAPQRAAPTKTAKRDSTTKGPGSKGPGSSAAAKAVKTQGGHVLLDQTMVDSDQHDEESDDESWELAGGKAVKPLSNSDKQKEKNSDKQKEKNKMQLNKMHKLHTTVTPNPTDKPQKANGSDAKSKPTDGLAPIPVCVPEVHNLIQPPHTDQAIGVGDGLQAVTGMVCCDALQAVSGMACTDALQPVTSMAGMAGSFDMAPDALFPSGDDGWDTGGQGVEGGNGPFSMFASLDSPFTNRNSALTSSLSQSGWPNGGGLFGAMPCDPAACFQTSLSPSMELLHGEAAAALDLNFDFTSDFITPFPPVADFDFEATDS